LAQEFRLPVDPARDERRRVVSYDGATTASYGKEGHIHFRTFEEDKPIGSIRYPYENPRCMEFSPDGSLLATANPDSTTLIWDVSEVTRKKGK